MSISANLLLMKCDLCAHVWTHTWMEVGDRKTLLFPIECPSCGQMTGYRFDIQTTNEEPETPL